MQTRSPFSGETLERLSIIRRTYGLIEDDLIALKKKSNGKCMICDKKTTKLNIDHDHSTGKVRGLLCTGCNSGLGGFRDNIRIMERALDYLMDNEGDGWI